MRVFNLTVLAFLLVFIAGCNGSLSGAGDSLPRIGEGAEATVGRLSLQLLAPDTVAVRDSFEVRFVAQNPTGDDVAVRTPNSCLAVPSVTDAAGERVPLKGSVISCAAVMTTRDIPARDAVERTFDMKAVLTTPEGEKPVSPGRYAIQVELDWRIDGEKPDLSTLGRELVVVDR